MRRKGRMRTRMRRPHKKADGKDDPEPPSMTQERDPCADIEDSD